MRKIKAIIFDLDGVLIDAKDWHYEALNRALGLFGMEISRYDHLVTYDGLPTKKKLEMLTKEKGLPQQLHEFINEMKQLYTIELIFQKCKPLYHHLYALSKFKKEGYRLCVCSNSVRRTIELLLDKSQLSGYIEFFLSNQDVKQAKPHPEIYQKAVKKLKLKPKECLVVEDNDNGIKAALACGANLLRVYNVADVNYENIVTLIMKIEGSKNA